MREIKFRAWKHVSTPEMFNDVQVIDFKSGIAHLGYSLSSFTERTDKERLDNLVLMQYTGLKDKNGAEIYEGDVLKRGDFPDEKPEFIVRFGEFTESPDLYHEIECLGWYVERIGEHDKYNTSLMYVIDMLDGIVCGNIYENPELIGDSQ